jgi:hypothetical protein
MVITIDVGSWAGHPPSKLAVGRRMAQLALVYDYGRTDMEPCGPLYESHRIEGNRVIVTFKHVGKGLMVGRKPGTIWNMVADPTEEVVGGRLQHFAITGADRVWHWADAEIADDTVIISSPHVPEPVAVRYAFYRWPEGANLYNRDGLPAGPFRTDDWNITDELAVAGNSPEELVEALERDFDRTAQRFCQVAEGLGKRASWAVPHLVRVLEKANNEWDRSKACEALSAIGPPEARAAVPALLGAIRHPSGNVRRYATKALCLAGAKPEVALRPLREALAAEKDGRVRDWMTEAIGHVEAVAAGKKPGGWRSK